MIVLGDVAQGVKAVVWLVRASKEYPCSIPLEMIGRLKTRLGLESDTGPERTRDLLGREYELEKTVSLSGDHKSDSFAKSETATAHPRSKLRGRHIRTATC
ncbi:Uncharacterised protein [uncultured archaeon]|nr:Uncharacterised protein [uncultured archaeon]